MEKIVEEGEEKELLIRSVSETIVTSWPCRVSLSATACMMAWSLSTELGENCEARVIVIIFIGGTDWLSLCQQRDRHRESWRRERPSAALHR